MRAQQRRLPVVVVRLILAAAIGACCSASAVADAPAPDKPTIAPHPRLYLTLAERDAFLQAPKNPLRQRIWDNFLASAAWCRLQPPRTEWIPTQAEDPQFENLYDRFYAAMHDLAIVETLAFASVLSPPDEDPYFDAARSWLLAAARVWGQEKDNPPDASKAYAVLRIHKGLAVGYDLLYPRLTAEERDKIRGAIVPVLSAYHEFFLEPTNAGAGYNKHHGSVDAAPFGVAALALLGEEDEAEAWLDLAIRKHVDYLLPEALTPSGTSDQSSNFWASTLLHRIQFMEALKRVTGRDLFQEFPESLPGRMALAAVAGPHPDRFEANEPHRSVLFGPNYGQLNYWSPVLTYLARHDRRSIYQYLASWDTTLGSLQRTRFITPTRKEELLFGYGHYALLWHAPEVAAVTEQGLPRVFEFPEPAVNEAYLRESFEEGSIVVAMLKGGVVLHAGGRAVFVDLMKTADPNKPSPPVEDMLVADDGRTALIRCVGPQSQAVGVQKLELAPQGRLTFTRHTTKPVTWWFMDDPHRTPRRLTWNDGTELVVEQGSDLELVDDGHLETPVHFGGMKFADPCPHQYHTAKVAPHEGIVQLSIRRTGPPAAEKK